MLRAVIKTTELLGKALPEASEAANALLRSSGLLAGTKEALAQLPAVEPGYVRMFRGELLPIARSFQLNSAEWLTAAAKSALGTDRAIQGRTLGDWSKLVSWHRDLDEAGISGRWFTPSLSHAKWYWSYHAGGIPGVSRIRFVDVPTEVAYKAGRNSAVQEWSKSPGEYFLPMAYRNKVDGIVPYRLYSRLPLRGGRPDFPEYPR